jgi:signal peptidase I
MNARGWRRAAAAVLIGGTLATTAALVFGLVTVVTTSGVSMNPTYHQGDLVIVARADAYSVGQVVAYHDHLHDLVVLHRLIGTDPTGYLFKGDNNASVDVVHPEHAELIGRAVWHVPRAGTWLHRLLGPVPLTALAVALLTIGGTAHRRRLRRRPTMSRHASGRSLALIPLSTLPPGHRVAAGTTAVASLLGLALAGHTWTTPVQRMAPSRPQISAVMAFSYTATVPRSPAYDGTIVRAPETVFRRVANAVEVGFAYQGSPGAITVNAELATANGWHSTVPLAARVAFSTHRYRDSVRLDLSALEDRAQAAATATGMPAEQLTVTIVPRVTRTDGSSFAPTLRLILTPRQLILADDPKTLTVRGAAAAAGVTAVPRTVTLLHRQLTVAAGRRLSVGLLLLSVLAALSQVLLARRTAPADESAAIRRRYAKLLLPVHPMPTVAGRPVVDVTAFATLAKLAERHGLLVLHWTRSDVDTFVVQDENTSYRYRTGDAVKPATNVQPTVPETAVH